MMCFRKSAPPRLVRGTLANSQTNSISKYIYTLFGNLECEHLILRTQNRTFHDFSPCCLLCGLLRHASGSNLGEMTFYLLFTLQTFEFIPRIAVASPNWKKLFADDFLIRFSAFLCTLAASLRLDECSSDTVHQGQAQSYGSHPKYVQKIRI